MKHLKIRVGQYYIVFRYGDLKITVGIDKRSLAEVVKSAINYAEDCQYREHRYIKDFCFKYDGQVHFMERDPNSLMWHHKFSTEML